ncbi:MAG: HGGxSTG domain-containing protein [Legionella sp.]|uniref:HGGxSTG domain-containing protein n=1 Tax=Legionella sp. TaxID=459 RepID=UPI0039E370CA
MKTISCTENINYAFDNAPLCGAKTKRNNGSPCRATAVKGKQRCRIHGGAKGSGGQKDNKNALKHGSSITDIKKFKKQIKEMLNQVKIALLNY